MRMSAITKKDLKFGLEKGIRVFVLFVIMVSVFFGIIGVIDDREQGEAPIGSFDRIAFSEGWELEYNGDISTIDLPCDCDIDRGESVKLSKRLPDDLTDGMTFLMKSTMEEVTIYVDGEKRCEYIIDNLPGFNKYISSAYIVIELNAEDAGSVIEMDIRITDKARFNEVFISYGNNSWFHVIERSMSVSLISIIVFILGLIIVIIVAMLPRDYSSNKSARNLGYMMIALSIWEFSESGLAQLVFRRPSLSFFMSYLTIETVCVLAAMYFDEVQHNCFHKRYLILETGAALQLAINIVLEMTGIMEFHGTLIFAHIWIAIGAVLVVVNICEDIRKKHINQYRVTAIGMLLFVVFSMIEVAIFYFAEGYSYGVSVSVGLLILMLTTIMQMFLDLKKVADERSQNQTSMTVSTIETIASAIDAKDEYTGGHSDRVGQYAAILAREMAADYDYSEEDIMRIHYVGLMHDIGKIGVADNVLNKAGRLTDEEFSLMKKHVEIGAELLEPMGPNIEGLIDGIRHHHERFDGKGYPDGLADTDIPLIARILCLADCYDAMTSNRVYRKRLSDEEVRAEFIRCSGSQFDPALTEIFVRLMDRGDLKPDTIDGMEAAANGEVLKSALIENRLQKALHSKDEMLPVKNPAHVRMMCYIVKLMEKKGQRIDLYFVGPSGDEASYQRSWEIIGPVLKNSLHRYDMNIEFSDKLNIVALFERKAEELQEFEAALTACESEDCKVYLEALTSNKNIAGTDK